MLSGALNEILLELGAIETVARALGYEREIEFNTAAIRGQIRQIAKEYFPD